MLCVCAVDAVHVLGCLVAAQGCAPAACLSALCLAASPDQNPAPPPRHRNRYIAQVTRSDTIPRRTGPVTLGEASLMMAEASQLARQQQQQRQQPQRGGIPLPPTMAGSARTTTSGYHTPASALAAGSPGASGGVGPQGSSPSSPSPGEAAAAAALAASTAAEQQQQQQQQGQLALPPHPAAGATEEGEGAASTVGSDSSAGRQPSSSLPSSQQMAEAADEGRQLDADELQHLQQRLSRATSSWAMHEGEPESEEEKEGAGPMHFSKQESWQRERALKNVFAPGSPRKEGKEDGEGGTPAGGAPAGGTPAGEPRRRELRP